MKIFKLKPAPRVKIITQDYMAKIPTRKIMVTEKTLAIGGGKLIHVGTKKSGQILKKVLTGEGKTNGFETKHYIDFKTATREQAKKILDILSKARKNKESYTIHLDTQTTIDGKEVKHNFEIIELPDRILNFKKTKKNK